MILSAMLLDLPGDWSVMGTPGTDVPAVVGMPADDRFDELRAAEVALLVALDVSLIATVAVGMDTRAPGRASLVLGAAALATGIDAEPIARQVEALALPPPASAEREGGGDAVTGPPDLADLVTRAGRATRCRALRLGWEMLQQDDELVPVVGVARYVVPVAPELAAVLHFETSTLEYWDEFTAVFDAIAASLRLDATPAPA